MITIVSGTNRRGAVSLQIAQIIANYWQNQGIACQILNLAELPTDIFSPDAYEETPVSFDAWQKAINVSEGIVWIIPEYNGGVPGALKLFIDMLDFPTSLSGTPCCLVGIAAGYFGGLRPVEQLASLLQYRNAHIFGERLFIPNCEEEALTETGFEKVALQKRYVSMLDGFVGFCKKLTKEEKEVAFD